MLFGTHLKINLQISENTMFDNMLSRTMDATMSVDAHLLEIFTLIVLASELYFISVLHTVVLLPRYNILSRILKYNCAGND
jgi:hypothetical protein